MSKTLVILDADKVSLNNDKDNDIMLWHGNHQVDDAKTISLLQIVENNAEYCKTEYVSLISKLGEAVIKNKRVIDHLKMDNNFSFWWTTLIAEKSNILKSPEINNAIKIIGLKNWLKKKNYTQIVLHSCNSKLIEAMVILSDKIKIKLHIKNLRAVDSKIQTHKKIYKYFPKIIQSLVWLLWELISKWPLKGVGIEKWYSSKSKITFLSSLINLDKSAKQKGEFKSNYWPILPDLLKNKNLKSNWIHIYDNTKDLPNASKARDLIKKFNNSKNGIETHTSIYSFVSPLIACKVILNLSKLLYIKFKIQRSMVLKGGMIWPFLEMDFHESLTGITAARNLLFMHLFKKAFTNLRKQEKGFYLQENQGWECTLVYSWRKLKHSRCLFAIPNTPIRFWDLRRIFDKKTFMFGGKSFLPIPDYMGFNSDILKNIHLKNGIPCKKLIGIEALRYLHLNHFSECKLKALNQNKYRVLLLGDILKKNTLEQMKLLKRSIKYINKPIQFILKPHPATPIAAKDCPDIDLIITDKPINEIVNCCHLVYAASTTASSFDAYYLGAKVVTFVNPQGLNTSPLKGFKDAVFASTPTELANVLNSISKIKKKRKKRENILFINSNIPRWKKIFKVN